VNRTGRTTRDRAGEETRGRSRRTAADPARRPAGRVRARSERTLRDPAPVTSLRTRRRGRGSSRTRRLVQAGAAVLVVAGLLALLWAGPVLVVRTVQVDGAVTLPAEQVQEAARVEVGTPLLQVDVAAAEARVARLPQVASVEVDRGWPSSVVITLVERTPVVVVEEAGRRSLVDGEGVLFDTISGEPPAGVVPLDVASPGPEDAATEAALAAVTALPDAVRERVAGATAESAHDVVLVLDDDTTVRWGTGEESPHKARVLLALLERVAAGDLEPAGDIDVSEPDAVVLR
jgi:cell division protein FtsQ